jgi:hypothetical protein
MLEIWNMIGVRRHSYQLVAATENSDFYVNLYEKPYSRTASISQWQEQ